MVKNKSQEIMRGSLIRCEPRNGADENKTIYRSVGSSCLKSDKGIALLMVLILSAVSLLIMTALLYMVTVGTQTSGMQKRYRTALEAGSAASDIASQIIGLHNTDNAAMNTDISGFLSTALGGLSASSIISSSCTGTAFSSGIGQQFTGLAAKIMTSSQTWDPNNCGNTNLSVDSTHYDLKFTLGTGPQFNVYAKIVDAVEGNTGGAGGSSGNSHKLNNSPVVSSSGEIPTPTIPYQYTIEVDAENANPNSGERAKLSILYQY